MEKSTIMAYLLKSFADLSWQMVVLDDPDDRKVGWQLLTLSPQASVPVATTPAVPATPRWRVLPIDTHGWRHGGINE